ncbi:hypothetical protein ES703_87970 [subsurface metagenome]
MVNNRSVGISHSGLGNVFIDRLASLLVSAFKRYGNIRAGRQLKITFLIQNDFRFILCRINLHVIMMRIFLRVCPRDNLHRLAGRQQTIHTRRRYPDALLAATHLQAVKLTAIQQPGKDIRNLLLDNSGAIVLNHQHELALSNRFYTD